jgi:hypothetical protein
MYSRESGIPFALYAYAGCALGRASVGRETNMTRDDAERLLRSLFDAYGVSAGRVFDGREVAGVMLGEAELFFRYAPERQTFWCGALVYHFIAEPRPRVLEAFFEEEASAGAFDAGGGALEYRDETRSLLLSRTYEAAPAPEEFVEDVRALACASLVWAREGVPRVASAVE